MNNHPLASVSLLALALFTIGCGADVKESQDGAILSTQKSGLARLIFVEGETMNVGVVRVGTSKEIVISIKNVGNGDARTEGFLSGMNSSAPNWFGPKQMADYPGVGGTCEANSVLPAGSSCTLVLEFHPQATGNSTGGVSISYLESDQSTEPKYVEFWLTGQGQ